MPEFGNVYTGKSAGGFVPGFEKTEKATADLSRDMVQMQKDKILQQRQDRQRALAAMQVDPIQVASEAVTREQSERIDGYVNFVKERLQNSNGQLSFNDEAEIQSQRMELMAWQDNQLATYNRALEETKQFDPKDHDQDYFNQQWSEYVRTGEYPAGGFLDVRALSSQEIIDDLDGVASTKKMNEELEVYRLDTGERGQRTKYTSSWGEKEARQESNAYFLTNDAARKRLEQDWNDDSVLDPIQKQKYLDAVDAYNDGKVTTAEKDNAILAYGYDRYGAPFRRGRVEEKPFRETTAEREDLSENEVLVSGRGVGVTRGTTYSEESGLSSDAIGVQGVDGVKFNVSNKNVWLPVPASQLDLPGGTVLPGSGQQSTVLAQPSMVANGKVEWIVRDLRKEVPRKEAVERVGGSLRVKSGYEQRGEKYYKVIEEEQAVSSDYAPVSGVINGAFPMSKPLIQDRGFGSQSQGGDDINAGSTSIGQKNEQGQIVL